MRPDRLIAAVVAFAVVGLLTVAAFIGLEAQSRRDADREQTRQVCVATNTRFSRLDDALRPIDDLVDDPVARQIVQDVHDALKPVECDQ